MKRAFEEPKVDIQEFGVEDVITASSQDINLVGNETETGSGQ